MDLRRVRPDEWQALKDLRLRALADAPLAFATPLADARARSDDEWRASAERGARGDDWVTFVADDGSRLLAMATGHFPTEQHHPIDDPALVSLMQMWVEPAARRTGLGRRLVDAVMSWAAERRSPVVRLGVTLGDAGAVAFYRAVGFHDTGRRDNTLSRLGAVMEMERRCQT